jgi:hypothetical protein
MRERIMTAIQETEARRLVDCISKSMDEYLGDDVKTVILYNFRVNCNLSIDDIPRRPDAFSKFLDTMFGAVGSRLIKKTIMGELLRSYPIPSSSRNSFESIIIAAKQSAEREFQFFD